MMTCSRCVMDTSDSKITFDEFGICNHCSEYDLKQSKINPLHELKIAKNTTSQYDCIIGLSGGVDSSYVAYYVVKKLKLNPLAIHVDNGWNSVTAVKNVKSLCDALSIDLETVVLDWDEFRQIQKAFILNKSADVEVPTDHAIFLALYDYSNLYKVPVINGINSKYESHHPLEWSQGHLDGKYIKSVFRKHYSRRLLKFKTGNFRFFWKWNSVQNINILDYVHYDKMDAINRIKELGWVEYGGKHEESTFTKWFQQIYLVDQLGVDKRRMHFSSLICCGETSRDTALKELESPPIGGLEKRLLHKYVLEKLGISTEEWDILLLKERSFYRDFKSYYSRLINLKQSLK